MLATQQVDSQQARLPMTHPSTAWPALPCLVQVDWVRGLFTICGAGR